MSIRNVTGLFLTAVAVAWVAPVARAQMIPVNLAVGDLTYQFDDATAGLPITSLNIPVGSTAKVALYLVQTAGTPSNILTQLGAEGLGVRLLYASPAGILQVPNTGTTTAQMQTTINANIVANPQFDLIQRGGSTATPPSGSAANSTTNTTSNAAITEGLISNPLAFPGAEDPTGNGSRMLIATFTLQGLANGVEQVTAVDPFIVQDHVNLTGPNPTSGPDNGQSGETLLDQYLTQYLATPEIPSLTVTVVPEPGTLALGSLAAVGLAAWRRRTAATVAA